MKVYGTMRSSRLLRATPGIIWFSARDHTHTLLVGFKTMMDAVFLTKMKTCGFERAVGLIRQSKNCNNSSRERTYRRQSKCRNVSSIE